MCQFNFVISIFQRVDTEKVKRVQKIRDKHVVKYPNTRFCITHQQEIVLFQNTTQAVPLSLFVYNKNGSLKQKLPPPKCHHREKWFNIAEVNISGFHDIAISCSNPHCKEITLLNRSCGTSLSAYKDNRKGKPAPGAMCQGNGNQLIVVDNNKDSRSLCLFHYTQTEFQLLRTLYIGSMCPDSLCYVKLAKNKAFIAGTSFTEKSIGVFSFDDTWHHVWIKKGNIRNQVVNPHGICSDHSGMVYIADGENKRVLVAGSVTGDVKGIIRYNQVKEIWNVEWDEENEQLVVYCNDDDGKTRVRYCKIRYLYERKKRHKHKKKKVKKISSFLRQNERPVKAQGKNKIQLIHQYLKLKVRAKKELEANTDVMSNKLSPGADLSSPSSESSSGSTSDTVSNIADSDATCSNASSDTSSTSSGDSSYYSDSDHDSFVEMLNQRLKILSKKAKSYAPHSISDSELSKRRKCILYKEAGFKKPQKCQYNRSLTSGQRKPKFRSTFSQPDLTGIASTDGHTRMSASKVPILIEGSAACFASESDISEAGSSRSETTERELRKPCKRRVKASDSYSSSSTDSERRDIPSSRLVGGKRLKEDAAIKFKSRVYGRKMRSGKRAPDSFVPVNLSSEEDTDDARSSKLSTIRVQEKMYSYGLNRSFIRLYKSPFKFEEEFHKFHEDLTKTTKRMNELKGGSLYDIFLKVETFCHPLTLIPDNK